MLENWPMSQLNEDSNDYVFQQDGSPAHYKDVRGYLNRNLPQRWIGRTGKEDDALMQWPPRSPDLTPFDFLFWGSVMDTVFVSALPANHQVFTTVSPLLWLWSTVICWHACGRGWTIAQISDVLPKADTLSICDICKKKTWRFSLSIGVRTTMIRWVVYLLRIFKMFHELVNYPVFRNAMVRFSQRYWWRFQSSRIRHLED